jgi:hypothetical protein
MSTVFKDEFIERYIAEGRAKGEAAMLLRMLSALGFEVPDGIRDRVLACNDLEQLGAWADAAATAGAWADAAATAGAWADAAATAGAWADAAATAGAWADAAATAGSLDDVFLSD